MQPITEAENRLVQGFIVRANNVLLYEDYNVQNLALEQIPLEILSANASKKASRLNSEGSSKIGEDDLLILELLQWFKFSFFTWVDVPKCETCEQEPSKKEIVSPSQEEALWGAHEVEKYHCSTCNKAIRFPRYNHPKKLLETRRGRCGEWANCFTSMCRALGYDARLVCEWGDHMWTEVYSFSQKRWLHCDPSENVCDSPLMYEIGWKKNISYVIAISKDEVQDVTWRYCTNYPEVMRRRTLYRESWLLHLVLSLTKSLQKSFTNERKQELLVLKLGELVTFLTPPRQTKDNEAAGRSSGSLAWREARGEFCPETPKKFHVFRLNNNEITEKYFHLKYSCAADKYIRVSDNLSETENWDVLTFDKSNIFRKVENDWKMAYISRKEGCPNGSISWKFDFSDSGLAIKRLVLNCANRTFENGVINWVLTCGVLRIAVKDAFPVTVTEVQGSTQFSLTAELSGGKGPEAWQHAQLFRQSLDSQEYPFEVEIRFTSKPGNSRS